jgi:hypothetical protein
LPALAERQLPLRPEPSQASPNRFYDLIGDIGQSPWHDRAQALLVAADEVIE